MLKKWWPCALLPLLIIIVYNQAYVAAFVLWDDDALIMNNATLNMSFLNAIKTAFSIYYHGDYFPLPLLSYWSDIQLFGYDAQAMHIINLGFQCLNTIFLFAFLFKLTQSQFVSLIACLFYAIHPLQTESVMWISERKSLLSAFFTFASLILYLETYSALAKHRRLNLFLSIICFIFASLAKATSILLPLLFILIDGFKLKNRTFKQMLRRSIPFLICALFLMFMRIQAYTVSIGSTVNDFFETNRLLNIPTMALNAIGFYIQKFVVPIGLTALYRNYELNTESILISIAASIFLVYFGIIVLRQKKLAPCFFYLWFILFLLPVLQIVPRVNYVNDRYMYLPIVGLVGLLVSTMPEKWTQTLQKPKVLLLVLLVLVPSLGLPSYLQSQVWLTNRSLWLNAIAHYPNSVIAHNNLGLDYQSAGQFEQAVEQYETILNYAIEENNKLLAYNNLANIYANPKYSRHSIQKSIQLLQEGISKVRRMRDSYEMRANLGIAFKRLKQQDLARNIFKDLINDLKTEPDYRFQWLVPIIQNHLNSTFTQ